MMRPAAGRTIPLIGGTCPGRELVKRISGVAAVEDRRRTPVARIDRDAIGMVSINHGSVPCGAQEVGRMVRMKRGTGQYAAAPARKRPGDARVLDAGPGRAAMRTKLPGDDHCSRFGI